MNPKTITSLRLNSFRPAYCTLCLLVVALPSPAAEKSAMLETPVKRTPAVGAPTTSAFDLTRPLQRWVEKVAGGNTEKRTVRLTIVNATPPAGQGVSLRVFLNKPNATAETATKDGHYVGKAS